MVPTHLAFELHLSFQKMLFSLLAEFIADFLCSFSYWLDEYRGILSQILKIGVSTLLAFKKLGD